MIHRSTEDEVETFSDIKRSLDFAFHKTERTMRGYSTSRSRDKGNRM